MLRSILGEDMRSAIDNAASYPDLLLLLDSGETLHVHSAILNVRSPTLGALCRAASPSPNPNGLPVVRLGGFEKADVLAVPSLGLLLFLLFGFRTLTPTP